MRELQATNSKVNLVTETGLTMTQNNLKVQKKETNSRRKKMLIRNIEFVSIMEIKGTIYRGGARIIC